MIYLIFHFRLRKENKMCDLRSKSHKFIFYGSFVYHVLDVMTFVLHRLYGNTLI